MGEVSEHSSEEDTKGAYTPRLLGPTQSSRCVRCHRPQSGTKGPIFALS